MSLVTFYAVRSVLSAAELSDSCHSHPSLTPMNNIREITRLNEAELRANVSYTASWHYLYRNSAYCFVGGLDYQLRARPPPPSPLRSPLSCLHGKVLIIAWAAILQAYRGRPDCHF